MQKKRFERPRIIFLNQEISGWPNCNNGSGAESANSCSAGDNNRLYCQAGTQGDVSSGCGQGNGYQIDTCQTGTSPDCCLTGSSGPTTGTCQRGNSDTACTSTGTGYGAGDDCSSGGTYAGWCTIGNTAVSCFSGGAV